MFFGKKYAKKQGTRGGYPVASDDYTTNETKTTMSLTRPISYVVSVLFFGIFVA
jgi:hypothetical protein